MQVADLPAGAYEPGLQGLQAAAPAGAKYPGRQSPQPLDWPAE